MNQFQPSCLEIIRHFSCALHCSYRIALGIWHSHQLAMYCTMNTAMRALVLASQCPPFITTFVIEQLVLVEEQFNFSFSHFWGIGTVNDIHSFR